MSYMEVKDLKKNYQVGDNLVEVLKGINLNIEKGEFCVLLGPSGCGKSTLLNIIGGIDDMTSGSICIDGIYRKTLNKKALAQYRRKNLGFIFQQYNLINNLTIKENIEVGAYLTKKPLDMKELLKVLGLEAHKNKLPNQVSGGQQQRTAIGRAVVKNPGLLLCDEPTGALDYTTSKEILKLIQSLNETYHTTILMVTHNDSIKYMADHVILLHDGNVKDSYYNKTKKSVDELEW